MRRLAPIPFKCPVDPRFQNALFKVLVVVVFGNEAFEIRTLVVLAVRFLIIVLLINRQPNVLELRLVEFSEQVVHHRARHFHALIAEAVSVCGRVDFCGDSNELIYNVSQHERLVPVVHLPHLRHKIVDQYFVRIIDGFPFGEKPDKFERLGLCEYLIRVVYRRNEQIEQLRVRVQVEEAVFHYLAITFDAERAHYNEERNRVAHIWNSHHDVSVRARRGWRDDAHRHCPNRFGRIFGYGAHICRMRIHVTARFIFAAQHPYI